MRAKFPRTVALFLGAFWVLTAGAPALADDTELFLGGAGVRTAASPNILFILDNSGSMGSAVETQLPYVASTIYPSIGCDPNRIYWRRGVGNAPSCSTDNWFNASALRCNAAAQAMLISGFYTDNMAQYDPTTGNGGLRWEGIGSTFKDRVVECEDDRGIHGNGIDLLNLYAHNGSSNTGGYWGGETNEISWGQTPVNDTYTLFSGNFLNWTGSSTASQTKLEILQDVTNDLLSSINGINVGLMYFNQNTNDTNDGGQVAAAIADVGRTRQGTQTTIQSVVPTGLTPLTETMYEATMYYSGRHVLYGQNSVGTSIVTGTNPKLYDSPINVACQKNYVVLLTDGEPTRDEAADPLILSMVDEAGATFASSVGATCDVDAYPPGFFPSGGQCLDDLAEFMYEGDWSNEPDRQNITTYTVGFTVDLPVLEEAAQRGGGRYYVANDSAGLTSALTNIIAEVLTQDISFTAPTVAVNAFNRTQNLSDLFISVFRPSGTAHWPGNLKKYRLRATDATIVDANGDPAVDPLNGYFFETAQSYWSSDIDGRDVELGGTAAQLPSSPSRRVFTNLSGTQLTANANRVQVSNNALTDAVLNTGGAGDPTREQVIDFINGVDSADADQDGNFTDPRLQMGDPFHSQPVSIVYGPGMRDGLIFMGTNDGMLHAIDLETGVEQWAFIPREFLRNQVSLFEDAAIASKLYGIDGDMRVQVVADDDGIIEPGEKVYLFFGMGRGGDFYYGLDVSDPTAPQLLWRLDQGVLPGLGQTWSAPMPTRINVAGATQNADKLVLVLGGGYEPDQDNPALSTDIIGNSIYIVDSVSGALLWHGSRNGTHKSFNLSGRSMEYSIPARVRIIDIDGDGFADRMFAGDMGGQIWRFDINNGQTAANLVNGGVIATLGGAIASGPTNVRRFYNSPDVAFINTRTETFMHIGIGSGHRGHPLNLGVEDYYYSIRDRALTPMTQAQFDARTVLRQSDLPLISSNSTVPSTAPGWRFALNLGGWAGEKVLAEGRTLANQVFFSTFIPSTSSTSCIPQLGTNRIYAMSVYDGAPVMNLDGSADSSTLTASDLFIQSEGGILPAAQALFLANDANMDGIPDTEQDSDGDGIADANDEDADGDGVIDYLQDADGDGIPNYLDEDWGRTSGDDAVVCVGLRCFSGVMSNNPIRTFWSEESVE